MATQPPILKGIPKPKAWAHDVSVNVENVSMFSSSVTYDQYGQKQHEVYYSYSYRA